MEAARRLTYQNRTGLKVLGYALRWLILKYIDGSDSELVKAEGRALVQVINVVLVGNQVDLLQLPPGLAEALDRNDQGNA